MAELALVSGTATKSAGSRQRLSMDFGNIQQLIDGASITGTPTVSATPSGLTISSIQLDYSYQVSALFAGGTADTEYTVTFTITLDDADATIISRKATLNVVAG